MDNLKKIIKPPAFFRSKILYCEKVYVYTVLISSALSILFSCRREQDVISTDSSIRLNFSTDTVSFDTIFSGIPSITRRLTVSSPTDKSIRITHIYLQSVSEYVSYSLVINGREQNSAENIILLGNDSLLILVNIRIEERDEDMPIFISNELIFEVNGNTQQVPVLAWGQDTREVRNQVITCNTVWTKVRPYLLYDTNLVDVDCMLTIEQGSRIHMASEAALLVRGTLIIAGDSADKVIIQGFRTDGTFANQPAQWGTIRFLPGSNNNSITGAAIKNGTIGLFLGTPDENTEPDLTVDNTAIENMAVSGIESYTSDLQLTNVLIQNCLNQNLGLWAGGNYEITHCTFDNSCSSFFREQPSVVFSNIFEVANAQGNITAFQDDIQVRLQNTIIWGNLQNELLFVNNNDFSFELIAANNIIRTNQQDLATNSNILNENPLFESCLIPSFTPDTLSPAINQGLSLGVLKDIRGKKREANPDIGAYEREQ